MTDSGKRLKDSTMARFCTRVSRKTIYSFCLVTATFWAILLLLQAIDRANVRKAQPRSPASSPETVTERAEVSVKASVPKKHKILDQVTTFTASPYNVENKKNLTSYAGANSKPKVIYWQASKTLAVLSTSSEVFQGCPVSSCIVSPSTRFYQQAHAVVFDDGKMTKQTPPQLKDDRVLVYYSMRTPNQVLPKAKDEMFTQNWKSVINWVWSYRLDSDIFQPFGYVRKIPAPAKLETFAPIVKKKSKVALWIDPRVDSVGELDKNSQKGKSKTDVEGFLRKVGKEISVDTYSMADLKAALNEPQSKKGYAMSKYYFILAFEWADCQDYVTDLFFDAFDPNVLAVPVVRGGFKYAQHFPKEIFVNADDFDSPKGLARYLQKLAANTKTYTRMLWRKSQYVREEGVSHAWCQLCEMLHRVDEDEQLLGRYDDVYTWVNEGGGCRVSNASDVEPEEVGTSLAP